MKSCETHFVTGVSSGLGHALARRWLENGATVMGLSRRRPEDLDRFANFQFHRADLAIPDDLSSQLQTLINETEKIDCVVLNAGVIGTIADMKNASLVEMKKTMDVNVWANKILLDALFKRPIAVRQVVAISSGAAVSGTRGWNGYSISKAALNMMISLYAKEQPDTHFTALAPGLIDTAMQDYLCALPESNATPMVAKLRAARGTDAMPAPEEAAARLITLFPTLKIRPSGSFLDCRNL